MTFDYKNDLHAALAEIYPDGFEKFDATRPNPRSRMEYLEWLLPTEIPLSEEELQAAANIRREKKLAIKASRLSVANYALNMLRKLMDGQPLSERQQMAVEALALASFCSGMLSQEDKDGLAKLISEA